MSTPGRRLRVLDAGPLSAVGSQALWHGLAEAMTPGADPVLSFCRPSEPYVCLGYHRRLDELDLDACHALGLPVLRRQIGGGPVYLDADQLFFQLTLPAADAPAGVARLYSALLEPAAQALRALGVEAAVDGTNDIVAAGRKVSGTGAGQIGEGVVVVGNVMFAFPHERMARVLAVPDEAMRAECLRLMRDHVAPLALDEEAVKRALRDAYAEALGRTPVDGKPGSDERAAIAEWEARMADSAWVAGPALPKRSGRQVKVRAGVWVYAGADGPIDVLATVIGGAVDRADVRAPHLNGRSEQLGAALRGAAADREALAERLVPFGEDGACVLRALEPGLTLR